MYIAASMDYSSINSILRIGESMAYSTRLILDGQSQAVHIPNALAYEDAEVELEIEKVGNELRIRPVRKALTGLSEKFATFPDDMFSDGREPEIEAPAHSTIESY